MAVDASALEQFPLHGLLPKREIGAERFLTRFPEFDGKGVLIAIFDSGVDPGAPGLQKLPDGQRKILDLLDCSGSGDVDMTTKRTVKDGHIEGLSGRQLKVPDNWNNPSGIFRVGLKNAYSLYPAKLKERTQKERKEKVWDVHHDQLQAKASRNLLNFEKSSPDLNNKTVKLEYEDLKSLNEVLQTINKKYKDPGPVYDCISFHDGETWRVCVDTSESGELEKCKLLASFKESGEYATFSDLDMLNYSVNIYNDGDIVSIVTNCSSHGTHVASISGAYFEEEPELNGIAPGAKIISMKIGDTKLESMETGSSIMRAMIAAVQNKVDVINMSYGEGCKWPNSGQLISLMNKLSKEHGIVFVSSAGNNGPALSTVGSPGGTVDGVIGVAAYVSPDMMTAEYSLLEKMPGKQYTWSSRGPCVNGSLGVCITAPGGAFTSVPNWTLRSSQLMNGTSMSSPNACGGIALLISALKLEGIHYSPISIRKYIECSAHKTEGASAFTHGYGMLQVDKAYDLIKNECREWMSTATFEIECGTRKMKGIYLREAYELNKETSTTITVTPSFSDNLENSKKIDFSVRVCLVSTESWIAAPSHLVLSNMGRSFVIKVDTRGLNPGAHYGEVVAYDTQNSELSPVFRIPVTVITPDRLNSDFTVGQSELLLKPGEIHRSFYVVPEGATWAQLTLKSLSETKEARYLVHALQLKKDLAFRESEFHRFVTLKPCAETVQYFSVLGRRTIELSLARWWTNIGDAKISWELSFHGLDPDSKKICLNGCEGFTRVDVRCPLGQEEISPSATLTHYVLPLRPREHFTRPLGERDVLPDGHHMYQLMLVYYFSLSKAAEVTPVAPLLYDLLYECKFCSQYWMIFDNNKRLYGAGDAFPFKNNYTVKLEKGDYVLKLELRHPKDETLERFKDMLVDLQIKLNTAINLDCYSERKRILASGNKGKFGTHTLQPGMETPLYITTLTEDKFPKGIKQGQYLTGNVSFSKKEPIKKATSIPLQCYVPPTKNTNDKSLKPKEVKEPAQEYADAHKDFKVLWISKLHGTDIQNELLSDAKEDAAVRNAVLNAMDSSKERESLLEKIIEEADRILPMINAEELLKYFGMKADPTTTAAKAKSQMESQRSILINVLYKKGLAMADILLGKSSAVTADKDTEAKTDEQTKEDKPDTPSTSKVTLDDLDHVFEEFMKWVDQSDSRADFIGVLSNKAAKYILTVATRTASNGTEFSEPKAVARESATLEICAP